MADNFLADAVKNIGSSIESMFGKKPAPRYTYDPDAQQYTAMKQGGKVSAASKRADGCATKGKTKGRFV